MSEIICANVKTHVTVNSSSDISNGNVNSIFDIATEIDLCNGSITVPYCCVLNFIGGSIKNGTITGNNTVINAPIVTIFGESLTLGGSWVNNECYPEWFDFCELDATPAIQAALDSPFPEVKISGRTYICNSYTCSHLDPNSGATIIDAILVLRNTAAKFKKIVGSSKTSWFGTGSKLLYTGTDAKYFLMLQTGNFNDTTTAQTSCYISNVKFDGNCQVQIILGSFADETTPDSLEKRYCREIRIESCQFIKCNNYSISLACWDCVITDVFCSSTLRLFGGIEGQPFVGTLTTTTLTNVLARNFIISGYAAPVELIGCTADGNYGDDEQTRFNAPYGFHLYGGQITMMGCYTEDFSKVLKIEGANLANIINCQFNCRQAAGDAKTYAVLVSLADSHDVTFINTKFPDCNLCVVPQHAYFIHNMVRCLFINCVINNRSNSALLDTPLLPERLWVIIGDEPAVINGYRKSGNIDLASLLESLSANVMSLELDANSTDTFVINSNTLTVTNDSPERMIKSISVSPYASYFNLFNISSRITYLPGANMQKLKVDQCAKNQDLSFLKAPLLTDIEALFAYSAATELTLGFDSSNIEHMHRLFEQCTNLKTVNFGDHWDCGNARLHVNNLFQGCTNLTTITGTISNLGKEFMNNVMVDLSPCPLTRESALVIINGLYDVATNGGPTGLSVKFHYNTFVNLLSTDLAIITSKGWTYSSAPQ